jgi:uncharacterized phage-like protein YoqJ
MDEHAITCCFTGHRPQSLPWGTREGDPRCLEMKLELADRLEAIYEAGWRHYLCGMAIGCDMYFAEAVLSLRQRHPDLVLEAAVPCDSQADRWNRPQREQYAALLGQCDLVTYVSHLYSPGCMMKRNQYMIDSSSLLLACFNGRSSGTMSTILYAERQGVRTIILDIE